MPEKLGFPIRGIRAIRGLFSGSVAVVLRTTRNRHDPDEDQIIVAAAVVAGLLSSSATTFFILHKLSLRGPIRPARTFLPFKFAHDRRRRREWSHLPLRTLTPAGWPTSLPTFPSSFCGAERARPGQHVEDVQHVHDGDLRAGKQRTGPTRRCPDVTMRVGRAFARHGFPLVSQALVSPETSGRDAARVTRRSLLGMPADADWVLQGPWLDKSLIRNAFSYDLARAMGCAAMRTRVCEVFLEHVRPARHAKRITSACINSPKTSSAASSA